MAGNYYSKHNMSSVSEHSVVLIEVVVGGLLANNYALHVYPFSVHYECARSKQLMGVFGNLERGEHR